LSSAEHPGIGVERSKERPRHVMADEGDVLADVPQSDAATEPPEEFGFGTRQAEVRDRVDDRGVAVR
jgi:hypothetical protein